MIENRKFTMVDYLAMLRRRLKVIVIPAVLAPLVGFLISYAFPAKYTSRSLIRLEVQNLPQGYAQPVATEDLTNHMATMQQQVLSQNRLQPMIERRGLATGGKSVEQVVDEIRRNVGIEAVVTDLSQIATGGRKEKPGEGAEVHGFYVEYTGSSPKEAQLVCSELTSMLLAENLKSREQVTESPPEFLSQQIEEAKRNLDEQRSQLATFKKQHVGRRPRDSENNTKILMDLSSQLGALTQTINRAQQDKSYAESVLARQSATWTSAQSSTNPATLEKQLSYLQSQLLQLQAQYAEDHPDVIKIKADISEVKKKLAEVNLAGQGGEPPEIRRLRLQVHQDDEVIAGATREQKRIQEQIELYQKRVTLSPVVEEQYGQLTRDYDTAQKSYADLLAKKSEGEKATDREALQQSEQMRLSNPANLPETPSFPNRLLFAGGGLGPGLALGLGIALWFEVQSKVIRTEQDVEAALQMPLLVSVPWVAAAAAPNGNGREQWKRTKTGSKH